MRDNNKVEYARELIHSLAGDWHFEVVDPNNPKGKPKQTGVRQYAPSLTDLWLEWEEFFAKSSIKLKGFFGYQIENDRLVEVVLNNLAGGLEVFYGMLNVEQKKIKISSALKAQEESRDLTILEILSPDQHSWTATRLEEDGTHKPAFKAIFTRE